MSSMDTQFAQAAPESFVDTLSISNLLSVVQGEAWMFICAALVYILLTSGLFAPTSGKKAKCQNAPGSKRATVSHRPGTSNEHKNQRRASDGDGNDSTRHDVLRQAKLIRDLGKERKLPEAIAAFDDMQQTFRSIPTMASLPYNSVLEACVQSEEMQMALKYFNEAKNAGLADVVTYNTLLKGHLMTRNGDKAKALLAEMIDQGLKPDAVTYHNLLHACSQSQDWRGAWDYVSHMRNISKLKPTSVTCSILLKFVVSPASKAYISKILPLFDEIEAPLDDVLISSFVEACLKAQQLDLLADHLTLLKGNSACQLSAPSYGAMIKAYGAARNVDQVRTLWSDMNKSDVKPTIITVGCLVDALVMNECVDEAWDLVSQLGADEHSSDLLNTVIYTTILKGFAMTRRLDKVLALYDDMRARKVECNLITFNTMLNAIARCGDLRRVPELLEDMKTADPPVEPDMITYSTIMKAYCSGGDLDMALAVLRDVEKAKDFTPDEVMYNSLLDGCAKQQRMEDALSLLSKMKHAGVSPSNYTLSIMIKLLGRAKRLKDAFSMLDELVEKGLRPNIQVYTCLMQACFSNRQLNKALGVHDRAVEEGCTLDEKAYISLATGCLQAKAVEKAAEVVRCAFGLEGHSLRQGNRTPGVDARCLDEVLAKLKMAGLESAASQLSAEVEAKSSQARVQRGWQTSRPTGTNPWRR